MIGPRPSISDLLARLTQLEERTAKAEERAERAEARVNQLANGNGHTMLAVKNDPISRRSMLTKAAAVGAAGVAGALLLNRPKDVFASFTWTGGTLNGADFETIVLANSGFSNGAAVLQLDANQGANGASNIDGFRTVGTGTYSGTASYGGNNAGPGYYGGGGPATGTGRAGYGAYVFGGNAATGQLGGIGLRAFSGANPPTTGSSWAIYAQGHGASDGTALGNGSYIAAAGRGYGLWADGGSGTNTTPRTNGGYGILGNGGPGGIGGQFYGDGYSYNPALPAHGVAGFGNALGVGGWFTGGRALLALGKTSTAGPPLTGQHFNGDLMLDANFVFWVCIGDGTPGTWEPIQPGGINNAIFTAVSTQQYTLTNSDGTTWNDIDATNLKLVITPNFNCVAHINASADLWTFNSGFNQDIGISVTGGALPTVVGQPEGWKESGGSAGTFSPNAAAVETVVALAAGTAYTVKLVWKASHNGTSKIAIGAGPINNHYSPTRLTARLVPTRAGGTTPVKPEQPYKPPVAIGPQPVLPEYRRS